MLIGNIGVSPLPRPSSVASSRFFEASLPSAEVSVPKFSELKGTCAGTYITIEAVYSSISRGFPHRLRLLMPKPYCLSIQAVPRIHFYLAYRFR